MSSYLLLGMWILLKHLTSSVAPAAAKMAARVPVAFLTSCASCFRFAVSAIISVSTYLTLSHCYIIISPCRSLSFCAFLVMSPRLVGFHALWLAIITLNCYCYTIPFLCLDRMTWMLHARFLSHLAVNILDTKTLRICLGAVVLGWSSCTSRGHLENRNEAIHGSTLNGICGTFHPRFRLGHPSLLLGRGCCEHSLSNRPPPCESKHRSRSRLRYRPSRRRITSNAAAHGDFTNHNRPALTRKAHPLAQRSFNHGAGHRVMGSLPKRRNSAVSG